MGIGNGPIRKGFPSKDEHVDVTQGQSIEAMHDSNQGNISNNLVSKRVSRHDTVFVLSTKK